MGKGENNFLWDENSNRRAWILWTLLAVVVSTLAFVRPAKRTVTYHYSNATYNWWLKKDLYAFGGHGFLYFPQSVHVYAPFAWQKWPQDLHQFNQEPFSKTLRSHFRLRLGEAFFRVCAVAFFAFALFRLAGLINGRAGPDNAFFSISLLSLPAMVTAAANGQFNTLLAAAGILAVVSVAQKKWNWAVFWLFFGVVVKPLGIVPLLLFGAIYRPLWPRLPIGLVAFGLLGLVHYDLDYVMKQWSDCLKMLQVSSIPPGDQFDDIDSMLRAFGITISHSVWFYIRAGFAPIFLAVSWLLTRKTDPWLGPILVGAAAATYLMLFNPRTETVSFHILAPFVAALAAALSRGGLAPFLAWLLVFLCIGWGSDNYGDLYQVTRLWWKPLLAFVFMLILFWWAFAKDPLIRRVSLANNPPSS